MEGYVVDAVPGRGFVELVLDGFRRIRVRTTFPVYVVTDNPELIAQHPSVSSYEGEEWRDLSGEPLTVYRFELTDLGAYGYISRRAEVVNKVPTVLSQTLFRLNALPFRRVVVEGQRIRLEGKERLARPKVKVAKVETYDWYGPSPDGDRYLAEVDGETERGFLRDLDLWADVVECSGRACDRVRASVKVDSSRKRSPVSIWGLVEWSYVSMTPLREIAYSTIGKTLTTNEAWVAFRRKVVIPDVVPRVEKRRTLEEVRAADKGGLVLFPKPGCYDGVAQVDFSSMYPSLIIKYNISAETVDACEDLKTEIGHSICLEERGIVPAALEWLVERRRELRGVDEERSQAIKWILVASFGYLGYRNSKFGKIEAYELVTYFARKTLRRAMEVAREEGLEMIHGIVDSLFVRGGDLDEFARRVEEETGMKLSVEKYDWVVMGSTAGGRPHPMRYYGRKEGGEVKTKGVERGNMPNLVRGFLREFALSLSKARDCSEAREVLRGECREILGAYERKAFTGEPLDYVLWIGGEPYVRGVRGFYNARSGYRGRDPYYYLGYLRRTWENLWP